MQSNRPKIYVGYVKRGFGTLAVFRSIVEPTIESHGQQYHAVIGPFRTMRGARFMARYGYGNPHCQTVGEAEWLAKEAEQERWLKMNLLTHRSETP